MIATEILVPTRKLKIKLSTKRIEVDPGSKKCEFREDPSQVDGNGCCNSKEKSCVPGSIKRGPQGSIEGHKEKKQKMDRKTSLLCATILKSLTSHTHGWVFNKPVDPVSLNIPDYFTVISQPMDLGTIKSKLEKNIYFSIDEFAADVRLTFSNAMTYNPPINDVHLMAKELKKVFERKWKDMEKKWKCEDEHGNSMTEAVRENVRKFCSGMHRLQKDTLSKKLQVTELKGIQKISSLAGRHAKVGVPKSTQIPFKLIGKDLCKDVSSEGSEGRDLHVCGADVLRQDCQARCKSPLQRKICLDSDGAVSGLDSEHVCSSSQLTPPVTDASSGEVWSTPVFDVQLSPKKALRAAMLKSRFADTILKAQQKTLLDHGDKSDSLKMKLEKERLERMQCEERARIEAQIKAAEVAARTKAEEEFKQRRDKDREAARAAIQKIERSVEVENNLEILEELELLSGCKLSYQALSSKHGSRVAMDSLDKSQVQNPLEGLGLFIKDEYITADEDEEALDGWEEGEIFD